MQHSDDEKSRRRELLLLWIALFGGGCSFSLVVPFLPLFVSTLNVDPGDLSLWTSVIYSSTFLVGSIALPVLGGVTDRFGGRPVMIAAALVQAPILLLCGLVTSPWQLLALRLLHGLTTVFNPAALAHVSRMTPPSKMGATLGLLQTAGTTGIFVGPMLGGILTSFLGFRAVFFVASAIIGLIGIMTVVFVRKTETAAAAPGPTRTGSDLLAIARTPILISLLGIMFLQAASLQSLEPIVPLYLKSLLTPPHLLPLISGAAVSIAALANVITVPFLGRYSDKVGQRRALLMVMAGGVVVLSLQGFVQSWWQLLPLRMLQGSCLFGAMSVIQVALSRNAPAHFQGRIFSLFVVGFQMGAFVGPMVGGILSPVLGLRLLFPLAGLLTLLNWGLVWWRVDRPGPPAELSKLGTG